MLYLFKSVNFRLSNYRQLLIDQREIGLRCQELSSFRKVLIAGLQVQPSPKDTIGVSKLMGLLELLIENSEWIIQLIAGRDMDLLELSAYGNVRRGQDSGGCRIQ